MLTLRSDSNQTALPCVCVSMGLVGLTLISWLFLSSQSVLADVTRSVSATVTVADACTLSGTVWEQHTATIPPGTYKGDGIGQTTLKVICNDNNGFAIYAIGYTGDSYTGSDHTKLIGRSTAEKIVTGTAESGSTSNWAMKLATSNSAPYVVTLNNGYGSFSAVPDTFTKVASRSSGTDVGTGATGAQVTTTYAAFIAGTQAADTYDGKVKYTLVHPATNVPNQERTCPASKICYWPNAGDMTVGGVGVADTMGNQDLSATTTLWASNFKRQGYGFAGWSDKYDWELNANDANGNGTGNNVGYHIYGPNQTLTLNTSDYSGTDGGLSLYAVWVPSAGMLQGWECPNLASNVMPVGTVIALTDTRDNNTYAVAMLADGNCWMIENLRLDYDANITTANTQSNNGAFGGVFNGLAQPEVNFVDSAANTLYKSDGSGDIKGVNGATLSDIGTTTYTVYRFPRYRNDNTNTNSTINPNTTVSNMTWTEQNVYSYGNYYTWAAAMANTNHYNTTSVDANGFTPSEAAGTSLCPTGWKVPYGRRSGNGATSGGFSYLDIQLGGTGTYSNSSTTPTGADMSKIYRSYPNNFLYSGRADTSSVGYRGTYGHYWASTAYDDHYSYTLRLYHSEAYPTGQLIKHYGGSIRCLTGYMIYEM